MNRKKTFIPGIIILGILLFPLGLTALTSDKDIAVSDGSGHYLSMVTATNDLGLYWKGTYTNNPGIRFNATSGKLEYRDQDESSWTTLDSLASGSGSGAPTSAKYITQTADGSLTAAQALGSLSTGILKNTATTGILSIATLGTDYYGPAGTDVAVADGGTGTSTGSITGTTALTFTAGGTNQNINLMPSGTGKVNIGNTYNLPTADGTTGQVLKTNGTGTLSWVDQTSGGAPTSSKYITQTVDATLSAEQSLGALATGMLKNTTTTGTGVLSIAGLGTDYYGPTGTDVAVADGGTGTSTGSITGTGDLTFTTGAVDNRIYFITHGSTASPSTRTTFVNEWGDVMIDNSAALYTSKIELLEGGASPSKYTIFVGGDQTTDVTYMLPIADGSANQVLKTSGAGVLSWVDQNTTGAPTSAKYITQTTDGTLSAEQSLGALTTGLLLNTVTGSTGVLSTATKGIDYYGPSQGLAVAVADGGTGTTNGSIMGTGALSFEATGANNGFSFIAHGDNGTYTRTAYVDKWGNIGTDPAASLFAGSVSIAGATLETDYALELPNDPTKKAKGNAWETGSDSRVKTNQQPIDYGLAQVLKLQPKKYIHHASKFENGKLVLGKGIETIGLVAQETYNVIPEAVTKPADENKQIWSMDYNKLVPVLVKAIQEQQAQIEELKKEIAALKK